MRTTARPGRGGFTLMELLLSMSMLSVIGLGVVALLNRAATMLSQGASAVETLDSLQLFAETFDRDIGTIYTMRDSDTGRPDVRLYADYAGSDVDADQKPDAQVQRFFFVRMIPNEATSSLTRQAGVAVEAKSYLDQNDDAKEAAADDLRATGGLMEVVWMAVPQSGGDPAVLRLFRGFRSPIGGSGSLLPHKPASDPSALPQERGILHVPEVQAAARPILNGVLHFGVQFWARRTKTWDRTLKPSAGGPLFTWDSSRGILPKSSGTDGFWFAKPITVEGSSLDDPTDDTFPRRIRVTLVVEELGRNAKVSSLLDPLSAESKHLAVEDTGFIPTVEGSERFVKVGSEWIQFEAVDGHTLRGCRRGARGTKAQSHPARSRVHHGRTVILEYRIPTYRDTYQDELPTYTGRGGRGR